MKKLEKIRYQFWNIIQGGVADGKPRALKSLDLRPDLVEPDETFGSLRLDEDDVLPRVSGEGIKR